MRLLPSRAVVALFVLVAVPAFAQPPAPPSAEMLQLKTWLTGEFDNFQQYSEAKESKVAQPHGRVHTVIAPIAAAAIGEHVLLARESALDQPDLVKTLHVYSLVSLSGTGALTLRLYAVLDPSILAGILKDPSKSVEIRSDQVKPMAGCDVTWRRDGDAFVGAMTPGACKTTWPRTGGQVSVTNDYRVSADEFWFAERLTDEAGTLVFGRTDGVPYKLKRARQFVCYAALRKEGTTDQYDGMLNVIVHDQGKWITVRTEDGKDTKYAFELSQLRYGQKVPVMKLALYEAGKDQAFAYTWAETTGKKIGINLRWLQVGCSIKE
ncbi:MAG: chromophore lyase CpcT/CpeT [Acidobacteria bacterium]|nr:chromophore lyase CpcT/CpeT [Acidobacteriota bacterium]